VSSRDYADFTKRSDFALPKIGDVIGVRVGGSANHGQNLIVTSVEDRGEQVRVYYYVPDPSETERG